MYLLMRKSFRKGSGNRPATVTCSCFVQCSHKPDWHVAICRPRVASVWWMVLFTENSWSERSKYHCIIHSKPSSHARGLMSIIWLGINWISGPGFDILSRYVQPIGSSVGRAIFLGGGVSKSPWIKKGVLWVATRKIFTICYLLLPEKRHQNNFIHNARLRNTVPIIGLRSTLTVS